MTSNEPPIAIGQPTRTSIASAGNDRISCEAQPSVRVARQRPEERSYRIRGSEQKTANREKNENSNGW